MQGMVQETPLPQPGGGGSREGFPETGHMGKHSSKEEVRGAFQAVGTAFAKVGRCGDYEPRRSGEA